MINLNKLLMSVIVATAVVVKAEESELSAKFEAIKKEVKVPRLCQV